MKSLADFLAELKRRRVFRVVAVYAGVAFIIGTLAIDWFPEYNIPPWVTSLVLLLIILGFPITIGLAWAFDITDKGIVHTKPKGKTATTKAPHPLIGNKTLAVVAVLAVIVTVWALLRSPTPITPIAVQPQKSQADLLGSLETVIPIIAVLPFNNENIDPEWDHFPFSFQNLLISELNHISGLIVRSQQSTLRFAGSTLPMPAIAESLRADFLVEGGTYAVANQVRINAQLIHGASDYHLWDSLFVEDMTDILSLQDRVAGAIARGIGLILTPEEEASLANAPQVNHKAYEAYSQGLFYYNKNTGEAINRAIEYFEQAIEIEPNYAEAYAGLAASYLLLGTWGLQRPTEIYPMAKDAAMRALEIDSMLPDARTSLAHVRYLYDWDWEGAEEDFKRALDIDPSNAGAHSLYALFLGPMGRSDEALREIRLAQELEPLILNYRAMEGLIYFFARDYDSGIDQCLKTLEMDSNFVSAHVYLLRNYHKMGMQEEAKAEFEKIKDLAGEAFSLSYLYAAVSSESEALEAISKLDEYSMQRYYTATNYAVLYASFGDMDRAFEWMEKAFEQRDSWLPFLKMGGLFDVLRGDPRFENFLHRMNFPE